jgi:serine phosphatase RsbU (regulator of sigma subunit)/ligand-binding sensor domain-containing protein
MKIYNTNHLFICISFILLCLVPAILKGQTHKAKVYSLADGFTEKFVYDITQNQTGYLFIATSNGLVRYDGVDFEYFNTENNKLPFNGIKKLYADKNDILLAFDNGEIGRFSSNSTYTSLRKDTALYSPILLFEKIDSVVLAVNQLNTIIKITNDTVSDIYLSKPDSLIFNSITAISYIGNSSVLIGTDMGLFNALFVSDTIKILKPIHKLEDKHVIKIITKPNNKLTYIACEEGEIYRYIPDVDVYNLLYDGTNLNNIRDFIIDDENNIIVASYNGLYTLTLSVENPSLNISEYHLSNVKENYYECLFEDNEYNIWAGTIGNGLIRLLSDYFIFYNHNVKKYSTDTRGIVITSKNKLFAVKNGITIIDKTLPNHWLFVDMSNFNDDFLTSIISFNNGYIVGTENSGLFYFSYNSKENTTIKQIFKSDIALENKINHLSVNKNKLIVSTNAGVLVFDNHYNLISKYNTTTGLPHNEIRSTTPDDDKIYISCLSNGLYYIENDLVKAVFRSDSSIFDQTMVYKHDNGTYYISTMSSGVLRWDGNNLYSITKNSGLVNNYCYFVKGNNKYIWVGHQDGLSLINPTTNTAIKFNENYGIEGKFNSNAVFVDSLNNWWFGTSNGTIKFDPLRFNYKQPIPKLTIKKIVINGEEYTNKQLIELPYGKYQIEIYYSGITFNGAQDLKYYCFLKGYDLDWFDNKYERKITYKNVEDGIYEFNLKACYVANECSLLNLPLVIIIKKPFWKQWWFIALIFTLIILVIVLIIKIREANSKRIRTYLTTQLSKRTKEIQLKNKQLEEINFNITSSINYALKIQKNILPDFSFCKQVFADAWMVYKPKDIVSGDFYYSKKIGEYLYFCVVDCTGHGVPGAFMSLISYNILNTILKQFPDITPDQALKLIEQKTIRFFSKQTLGERLTEGMDMIFCKYDIINKTLHFSSASRPLWLIRNNKLEEYRTSKFTIGELKNINIDKKFETYTLQMQKDDIVYLSTDGIIDQFGGPNNKKIGTKRLKDFLLSIAHLPGNEQQAKIEEFLNNWQGNEEQVDDILIVGFKI